MFAAKSTTSPTSIHYGALLTVIFQLFSIDCLNESLESSFKPFDKLTMVKSLYQFDRTPPIRDSDSDSTDNTNIIGFPPEACVAYP